MYKIGLTGSIGSGKSTVSGIITERGILLIDADEISRNLTSEGSPIIAELVEAFGEEILTEDGKLDRRRTAEVAFSSQEGMDRLTSIVTNKVKEILRERTIDLEKSGEKLVFFDIPLLFENNLQGGFNEVWTVAADREIRYERAHKRDGISKADFDARDKTQTPQETKVSLSDVVFYNNSTLGELEAKVKREVNRVIFYSGWINK